MARPKRSRFMGHDYSISYVPSGSVKDDDGSACWGITDPIAQVIRVEDNLTHDRERCVTLHEVLHQLFYYSRLDLDDEAEESIVSFLGDALVGHLKDNPSFWRYLQERQPQVPLIP